MFTIAADVSMFDLGVVVVCALCVFIIAAAAWRV